MNYLAFWNCIDWEMRQSLEKGDSASEYAYINKEQCMFYTNETIRELVNLNGYPFVEEETYYFNGKTSIFNVPEMYHSVLSIYNTDTEKWESPIDASDMDADPRAVSARKLSFVTPKEKGDSVLLRVVKYPPDITSDSDAVPFPDDHLRFLRLSIMAKVFGRKGKMWNDLIEREYQQKLVLFTNAGRPVKNATRLAFRGHGFGRR